MLKDDIKKVKDQGKLFERLSTDYDMGKTMKKAICFVRLNLISALQRHADASKSKGQSNI